MKRLFGSDRTSRINMAAAATAVFLLGVFATSVGNYFARPPSTGMSRELELAELSWEYGTTLPPQVVTVPTPDGTAATIIAADTSATELLRIDERGAVLDRAKIDLDLSRSRNLAAYHSGSESVVLFSGRDELVRTDIDIPSRSFSRTVVVPEMTGFDGTGRFLAVLKEDQLLLVDGERDDGPVTVHDGPVLDYAIGADTGRIAVATITGSRGSRFSVNLHRFSDDLEPEAVLSVLNDSQEDTYRRLEAVRVQADLVDLLFSLRDTKFGRTYLTVLRVSGDTGAPVAEWTMGVPIMNSRYDFVGGDTASTTFVMRLRTDYGYNLVTCTMSAGNPPVISELTKTRPLSDQSLYFSFAGHDALVFSDIQGEQRTLYYASDHPAVVRQTSRWTASTLLRSLVAVLGGGAMALVLGSICLLITSVGPYFAAAGVQRLLGHRSLGNYAAYGAGVLVYAVLKLVLSHFILRRTAEYGFWMPIMGSSMVVYLAVTLMTVVAAVLVLPLLRPGSAGSPPATGPFVRFAIIDTVLYSFLFLIYSVTSLFIAKL